MGNPREVALLTLSAGERQGAWSDVFLKKAISQGGLDSRDAALCTRICFGVLQHRAYLDFLIGHFSTIKVEKLEEKLLQCLRIGAYQMCFLDRIPHSAAVNESVNLAKKYGKKPKGAGLVNGILRNLSRQIEELPVPQDLATQYSHPQWLVDQFIAQLGEEGAKDLMEAHNQEPPTVAQVNTIVTTTPQLVAVLTALGVAVMVHPWLPDCLYLSGTGNLEGLDPFQKGHFYIQDPAAKLAVMAANPQKGMTILDACAAPGGKSFATAIATGDTAIITSCDIHANKMPIIQEGANRLGLESITPQVLDGRVCKEEYLDTFDVVVADVPCSGLGIIRKKPDIRYKDPKPLSNLPTIQKEIIDNVSHYVKVGGVLLYATCTILKAENQDVVNWFISTHPNFQLEPFTLPMPQGDISQGMTTLWPHIHETDGFFFAKLRRIS